MFENGIEYKGSDCFYNVTYESNMPYALRFMIDNKMGGMSWLRLQKDTYQVRDKMDKVTSAQIEIDIQDYSTIEPLPFEGPYSKIAPLRILSFDIECSAEKGRFPVATQDPIIQIANIVKTHGEQDPFVRNVFTLKNCAPIVGT